MVGKDLIVMFFGGQIVDLATTQVAIIFLNQNEVNPIALLLFNNIGMEETMIFKMLLTAFLIIIYLLSFINLKYFNNSIEKSLQIASVSLWLVAYLNIIGMFSAIKLG